MRVINSMTKAFMEGAVNASEKNIARSTCEVTHLTNNSFCGLMGPEGKQGRPWPLKPFLANARKIAAVCAFVIAALAASAQAEVQNPTFPFWKVTGNSGTSSNVNFVGTTDNKSLRFRTNNIEHVVIDSLGNVGIGTTSPVVKLHVVGSVRMVDGNQANGYIMVSDANGTGVWTDPTTITTGTGDHNTLDEAYDEGGAGAGRVIVADNGALRVNGDDGFIVTGTRGSGDLIEVTGSGTRMFFNPNRAALRAGDVDGVQWNVDSIGDRSIALGYNTIASNAGSIAIGYRSRSRGTTSVAMGFNNDATNSSSVALGQQNVSSGFASTALGGYSTAAGDYSTTIGRGIRVTANYSFGIALSDQAATTVSTANVMSIMGGNVGIGTTSPYKSLEIVTSSNALNIAALLRNNNATESGGNAVGIGFHNETASGREPKAAIVHERLANYGRGSLHFLQNNTANTPGVTLTDAAMTITMDKKVGIGTTAPQDILHIVGHLRMVDGSQANGYIMVSDANGTGNWTDPSTLNLGGNDWSLTGNSGTTAGTNFIGTTDAVDWVIKTNGVERARMSVAGNFGVGTTTPVADVHITGHDGFVHIGELNSGTIPTTGAGVRMMWYSRKAAFRAGTVSGTDWDDSNTGYYSFAAGQNVRASGNWSVAVGSANIASNDGSFAAGGNNTVSGQYSAAFGYDNTVSGNSSLTAGTSNTVDGSNAAVFGSTNQVTASSTFAAGNNNRITGHYSAVAGGYLDTVTSQYSLSTGTQNLINSEQSFAAGFGNKLNGNAHIAAGISNTIVSGNANTALGYLNTVSNNYAAAIGDRNTSSGLSSLAINYGNTASGNHSLAGGALSVASGHYSMAMGYVDTVSGESSVAFGNNNNATGWYSIVAGSNNQASNTSTAVFGTSNVVSGANSLATGSGNIISSQQSAAFGNNNAVSGSAGFATGDNHAVSGASSFANGGSNIVSGSYSLASGAQDTASGFASAAFNRSNVASGNHATAIGSYNTAPSYSELSVGMYSTNYTATSTGGHNANDRVFNVGIGTGHTARADALTILKNGNVGIGTSTPATDLHVVGSIRMVNGTQANGYIMTSDANGTGTWTNPTTLGLGNAWNLTGNSGTVAGTNFIGTTDAVDWVIRTNNTERARVLSTGNVGIATTSPDATLDVQGNGIIGISNTNTGTNALATGISNSTAGNYSFTSGQTNTITSGGTRGAVFNQSNSVTGNNSIAGGFQSNAGGNISFALGYADTATGQGSTAFGFSNIASANYTFAAGSNNNATAAQATAFGNDNTASGTSSFVTGSNNTVSGSSAFVSGNANTVSGTNSIVGGNTNAVTAGYALVAGNTHNVAGNYSVVLNNTNSTTSAATTSIAGGFQSQVQSNLGVAIGWADTTSGVAAAAFGRQNRSTANYAFAAGYLNTASGAQSAVFGNNNTVSGTAAFASGDNHTVSNTSSIAAGGSNIVSGAYSVGMGAQDTASGYASAVFNRGNAATGNHAVAMGSYNTAPSYSELSVGMYSTNYTATSTGGHNANDRVFNVGIGTGHTSRADALTILKNGNVGITMATPNRKLYVNGGNILATGTTTSISGIELMPRAAGTNAGARVYFREDNDDLFGFSVGFNGGNSGNEILNWPANSFNISAHNNSATGAIYVTIPRITGNVGINNTNPQERLHVTGSIRMEDGNQANGYVMVSDANGTGSWTDPTTIGIGSSWNLTGNSGTTAGTNFIGTTDAVDWVVKTTNSERMRVTSGGNIGMGHTNPLARLVVAETVDSSGVLRIHNPSNQSATRTWIGFSADNGWGTDDINDRARIGMEVQTSGPGELFFTTGGYNSQTERMRIDQSGDVGIGTRTPADKLHVVGSIRMVDGNQANGYVMVSDANGSGAWASPSSLGWTLTGNAGTTDGVNFIGTTDNIPLTFRVNNQHAGRIDPLLSSTFFGYWAGLNTTGTQNTAVGINSLMTNTSGARNTAHGTAALQANTTGNDNTAVGAFTLETNTDGTYNTALGQYADVGGTSLTNATAIGAYAQVNTSNTLVLGSVNGINGASATVNVGVGTNSPTSTMHINGGFATTVKTAQAAGTNNPDNTAAVWVYSSGSGSITLPTASTCSGRRYVILNQTGGARTTSTYIDITTASVTSVANNTSIEVISDGTNWRQIK